MKAHDIMTVQAEGIQVSDSVLFAARKMDELGIGAIAVFDRDQIVGILTDRDIVLRVVAKELEPATVTSGEVMTAEVVSCSEEADIQEVKRLMEDKQVRRLVITNQQGRCTGIVSLGDVAMSLGGQEAGEVLKEVVGVAHPQR